MISNPPYKHESNVDPFLCRKVDYHRLLMLLDNKTTKIDVVNKYCSKNTNLSTDMATRLNMLEVEEVTSIAMYTSHTKAGRPHEPFTWNNTFVVNLNIYKLQKLKTLII